MSDSPVEFAIYRAAKKDGGQIVDVPFLLLNEHNTKNAKSGRKIAVLSAKGRKLKQEIKPIETVIKGCTVHQASKKQLQKRTGKFVVLSHLSKCSRDGRTGRMEVATLSPCAFTREHGQFSPVLEPALAAFVEYEKRHPPACGPKARDAAQEAPRAPPARQAGGQKEAEGKVPPAPPQDPRQEATGEVEKVKKRKRAAPPKPTAQVEGPSGPKPTAQEPEEQGAEVRKNKKTKKTGAAVGNPSKPSVEARQEDAVKKPAIKQEDAVMNPAIKQEQDVAEAEEAQQPQGKKKKRKNAAAPSPEPNIQEREDGKQAIRTTKKELKAAKGEKSRLAEVKQEHQEVADKLTWVSKQLRKRKEKKKALRAEIKGLRQQVESLEFKFEALRAIILA